MPEDGRAIADWINDDHVVSAIATHSGLTLAAHVAEVVAEEALTRVRHESLRTFGLSRFAAWHRSSGAGGQHRDHGRGRRDGPGRLLRACRFPAAPLRSRVSVAGVRSRTRSCQLIVLALTMCAEGHRTGSMAFASPGLLDDVVVRNPLRSSDDGAFQR